MASCQSDEKKIEKVSLGYLNATANYNANEAMIYATRTTRDTTLPFLRDVMIPLTDTNYIKANTPATVKIDNISVGEDTAWVRYTRYTPAETTSNMVRVTKENGQWLVDVPLALPQPSSEDTLRLVLPVENAE